MSFRPDIKPPQWGPPDALRYAVRANAERLGIDPASIDILYPFFDNNALFGGETSSSVGGLVIDGDGIVCSGTNYISNSKRIASSSKHCVVSVFTPKTLDATFTFGQYQKTGGSGYEYGVFTTNRYYTKNGIYVTFPALTVGSRRVLIDICDGVNSKIFSAGAFAGSAGALSTSLYDYQISGIRDSVAQNSAIHHLHIIFKSDISETLVPVFSATPYALLMPVSRPVYFDMGGGGSSSVTSDFATIYDIRALVNSDFATTYDLRQIASSDFAVAYDILQLVFSDFGTVYDIRQEVSSDYSVVFDVRGFTESDFAAVYDMAGRVFSDFTVTYDVGDTGPITAKITGGFGLGLGLRL